ncbi:hypothetical protein DPEC_G00267340 [Dallia pectoralis]|uniref:Uncharacterized protein n=1 Tax=Dallia pectoralis TaxID=75939 RepID=A0ACC2FNY8_DALPE|nr:hypothetical protein DPEC_G00267340 [Dallia pectoralis]
MDLPSITHMGDKAADNAVKWQLCYDMTAKTWWMPFTTEGSNTHIPTLADLPPQHFSCPLGKQRVSPGIVVPGHELDVWKQTGIIPRTGGYFNKAKIGA